MELRTTSKKSILALFALFLLLANYSYAANDINGVPSACTANIDGKTEQELQYMLERCEAEINAQKVLLEDTKKTSRTLEQAINDFTARIKKAELEIKARSIKITQLGDNIVIKKSRINELTDRLERVQISVGELVRKSREFQDYTPMETLLSNQDISEFFVDVDSFASIKDDLHKKFLEVREVKQLTEKEKKSLEDKKTQEQILKFNQEQEKRKTENVRLEQKRVLTVTKGQEDAYKRDIANKERIKNEIRNRIFRTVGGSELTFGEALKLVQPYEARVGVSAALTLAVLTQESSVGGVIGKNIGKCFYNQTARNPQGMVMKADQRVAFEAIAAELGINPDTTPVSCPIYSDGAYGGAMGPAQFMPITWQGFATQIASVLGISNPSPFQSLHAFTGTALYLSDAQNRCKTAFSSQYDIWRCAAAKYYSGLASSGSRLSQHMNGYGYQVAKRAQQFQKDIDTLDL